jgi:hypothetical protein
LRTVTVDRLAVPIDETAGPAAPGAWLEASAVAPLWPGQPWVARSLRVDFGPQAPVQGSIDEIGEGMPARWQVGDTCVVIDGDFAVERGGEVFDGLGADDGRQAEKGEQHQAEHHAQCDRCAAQAAAQAGFLG